MGFCGDPSADHNKISGVNKTAINAINNNKVRRNAQALPTVFDGSTIEDR